PAFVAVRTMPGWLQPFANHQPIGVVVTATRALMHGGPTASLVLQALAWCFGLLLLFIPFAVRQFRRRT
ncbi:MAG TPA: ABC transporter permease, partial [Acidimicrobiales bacterium]|nr:ABC transporter permease [Acidimicrobiales bacterium]